MSLDWQGEGIVLATRPHGEGSAILTVLTPDLGRLSGLIRGGSGRRLTPVLQPGNRLRLTWKARLETQLGTFTADPVRARAGLIMADRQALAALSSVCALLMACLPEREPHPALFEASDALLEALVGVKDWPLLYLKWELGLLEELGFGLDLSRCAVTGASQGLAFVSPKSGRAVTWEGAEGWAAKLLPLPACLTRSTGMAASPQEMQEGLRLTGHFLARALAPDAAHHREMPAARQRLPEICSRQT